MLELGATDPEGTAVNMAVSGLPEGAILEETRLRWLPTHAQAGTYPMAVDYDDGQGGTSRLRFDIGVQEIATPVLLSDPALVDFGDVTAGQNAEATFVLHNPTAFTLQVENFISSAGSFAVVQPPLPIELAPDARAECIVRFSPKTGEAGIQQAVLTGRTGLGAIQVPVAGRSLWSGLATEIEAIDFGARTIGFAPWQRLKIVNPGNLPLTVQAEVPADGPFRIEPLVITLAGGQQTDLRVYYTPKAAGLIEQTLLLKDFDHAVSRPLSLRGWGLTPEQGRVTIDFNLAAGNQQQRRLGDVRPGEILDLQLHVQGARQIAGWSARIAFDPLVLAYVPESFVPGVFLPNLVQLEHLSAGYVEIGGDVLDRADPASGSGVLGTLSFQVQAGFAESAQLAVTQLTWHRAGSGGPARDIVYAPATIVREAVAFLQPGDFDGNGNIDLDDFFLFADQFQRRVPPAEPRFDLDDDGQVFFDDFFLFADLFGQEARN